MNLSTNLNTKEKFSSLITSIENDLYNIAENKIDNPNDIEDVIQETIIKAYKSYENLNKKEDFKTWTIKILLNECYKNHKNKHKDILLLKKIIFKEKLNIEDYSISKIEANLDFKDLLNNLSTTDQDIFIFYYQCNYSIKEIADILQLSESTIKNRIKRNKEKLEKIIKGDLIENKF